MNIFELINQNIDVLGDKDCGYEEKVDSLNGILSYVNGIEEVPKYLVSILRILSDEIDSGHFCSEIIQELLQELRLHMHIPRECKQVNIIIGKTWISRAIKEILENDGEFCIYAKNFNWLYVKDIQGKFLICEEDEQIRYDLERISEKDIIKIYKLINADVLNAYQLKSIVRNFQQDAEDKMGECLVSGLSYGRDAIHVDLLKVPTLTLANSSQDLYYDFLCLKYAHNRMSHLKYVINIIAPYSLRYDESLSPLKNPYVLYYYTLFGDVHHNKDVLPECQIYDKEKNKANDWFKREWDEYSNRLYDQYRLSHFRADYCRTSVFEAENIDEKEIAQVRKQYDKPYEETIIEYKQILRDYCSYCKENGIKLLFVIPPFSIYYKRLWDETYIKEVCEYLELLKQEYTIDYICMCDKYYSDDCFRDSGHLNRIGAIYVAKIINKWIDDNR